eukprot:scaffold3591_cov159-Amphora_coffeaeformis.AAC.3
MSYKSRGCKGSGRSKARQHCHQRGSSKGRSRSLADFAQIFGRSQDVPPNNRKKGRVFATVVATAVVLECLWNSQPTYRARA